MGLYNLCRNHNQNLSYKYCNYSFVLNLVRNLGVSQLGLSLNGAGTILLPTKHFSTVTTVEENQQGHPFKVSYLINSCGLSPEAAISASNKVHFTSPDKPDSALAILRKYGFENTHISKIIGKHPQLLLYSPKKILIPKLDFFRSLGFSDSELAHIFTSKPHILNHSLQNRIIPCRDFLKSVFVTNTEVAAAMKRGGRIFQADVQQCLGPNVQVLRQAGVPHSVISFALRQHPNLFPLSNNHFVAKVKEVIELGVDPTRQSFARALVVVIAMSKLKRERKVQVFKSWGCSDDEISAAFRNYPDCMLVSEKKIMSAMEFLVNEMGVKPSDIASYPIVLNYSLEKRIIPRFSVVRFLQLKGLLPKDSSPATFLKPPEREFLDKVVTKYGKQVPQLLSIYQVCLATFQAKNFYKQVCVQPSFSYPKVTTWNIGGGREDEYCSWDGVECDPDTGHVIGFDLNSSFLYGSIDSTSTLFTLTHLRRLNLTDNHFNYSQVPPATATLSLLSTLNLSSSVFSGPLPASLGNLTKLTSLDLSKNLLQGQIPSSFSELESLEHLDLSSNGLNGTVHADVFLNLKNLSQLHLSYNAISLLTNNTKNTSLPKFKILGLGACNLSEFPDFLRFQEKLEILSLVKNKIQHVPGWMMNGSRGTLGTTRDWDHRPVVLPWAGLRVFDLRDNMLEGPFPLPPPNIYGYSVSKNRLTGEIPPMICHRSSLYVLDLSDNNMSGTIPPCSSNFSVSLSVMNLKGNNFCGSIPRVYTKGCNLMMIDLSQNQLRGQVPRSMANCRNLEVLNLGENQIHDNFPIWFGALPELQVLIFRSNNLNGEITTPTINLKFPKLHIIDLSHNAFTGSLPLIFFRSWNAMKIANIQWRTYLASNTSVQVDKTMWRANCQLSLFNDDD